MKVVRAEDVELMIVNSVRDGKLQIYYLLDGIEGSLSNYMFCLCPTDSDYQTPRHRHNFDQIRYQIKGSFDYSKDGVQKEGSVGYFPEGTSYGPAQASDDCLYVVLQVGGASGSGYMSLRQHQAATAELKKTGEFANGVYTRRLPDGGKKNSDSYEAVWEHVFQRKAKYPAARYDKPIFMQPENFEWIPSQSVAGVATKTVGIFGERGLSIGFVRLEAGVQLRLEDASLYFVAFGTGTADGKPWQKHSAIRVDRGETVHLRANETSEIMHIKLPSLEHLEDRTKKQETAHAAV